MGTEGEGRKEAPVEEELRDNFLSYLARMKNYCLTQVTGGEEYRMNLFIFSILTMLDGEAGDMPPHKVNPMISIKDGEEWKDSGIDIAGSLHEAWKKFEKPITEKPEEHVCHNCSDSNSEGREWCRRGKPLTVGQFEDFVERWKHES